MIDDSKEVNKTGTGLGLFISKKLSKYLSAEQDEGIRVESEYGSGSIFYFVIENK